MVITGPLELPLLAGYLVLWAFTGRWFTNAVTQARGASESFARRLWAFVGLLTFPFSLLLVGLAEAGARLGLPARVLVGMLSWGARALLLGLTAFWAYQAVNVLAPSIPGRAVVAAYIVSVPLLFAAADLAARRYGQKESDSRTWLRAVMAVTWVLGLATVAYLEAFHRRRITRQPWMDVLAIGTVAVVIAGSAYGAVVVSHPSNSGQVVTSPPTAPTAPPTARVNAIDRP